MLTWDEIYDVDPSFRHLENFVDRLPECQKFTETATLSPRDRSKSFLGFYGSRGVGKSALMDRLHFECKRRQLLAAHLNFEDERLNDPVRIMTEIIAEFGEENFDTWLKKRQLWNSIFGLEEGTQSQTSLGISSRRDVNIGGDVFGGHKYQASGDVKTPAQRDPEEYKRVLTEIFSKDLSTLLQQQPVVILLDNLDCEKFPAQTRDWVMENLLDKPRRAKGHGVLAVMTSMQELDELDLSIYSDRLQYDTDTDEILPLERDHIREYMRARKIPDFIVEQELEAFMEKTQGIPKQVIQEITPILKALKEIERRKKSGSGTGEPT